MITDCVPFAVWISLIISIIITCVLAIKQDWFYNYMPYEGIVVIAVCVVMVSEIVLSVIPVETRTEKICVLIKNTKVESYAFDLQSKKFICSFPMCDSRTNGIYEILAQRKVGFTGSGVSSEINYYIPLK